MSWFDPHRRYVEPDTVRPVESALNDGWCDACKRYRVASELDQVTRGGVDLVICRTPGPCIAAAKVARLWKE